MKLWVDDVRPPAERGWYWARTSREALWILTTLKEHGHELEAMSLDHDLGHDDTTRPIVLWMCENEWWPQEVRVHSANPVGVEWLEGMIERYKPVAD